MIVVKNHNEKSRRFWLGLREEIGDSLTDDTNLTGLPLRMPQVPALHAKPPDGSIVLVLDIHSVVGGDERVVDAWCCPEGSPEVEAYGPTTISLALERHLDGAELEHLKKELERRLNAIQVRYGQWINFVEAACEGIGGGVLAYTGYVPG